MTIDGVKAGWNGTSSTNDGYGTPGNTTGNVNDGVVFTAPGKTSTGSGDSAWMSLLNGNNFTGLANIISAFKGNPTATTTTLLPTTAVAPANNTLLIIGGVVLLAVVAYFFMKKD